MTKFTQNSISLLTLHVKKLQNHLQEISLIKGFPIEKACPNFPKSFSFDLVEFSLTKLFNIQSLLHCLECP
jgi:hypothetical protein